MATLTAATGSQRRALEIAGVSRSTWHYRGKPRPSVADPVHQRDRRCPTAIPDADRHVIAERVLAGWEQGNSVDHAFASAWDDGLMLGSRRSWWRIAAAIECQASRPVIPTRKAGASRVPRQAPVLVATAPMDVWSWDITDLRSPWWGISFKAYSVMDIFSRKVVGWRVEQRESDAMAVEMFERAFGEYGIPTGVHSDSGPAMRSNALAELLASFEIAQTFNRPRVSNDNPFSEAEFRTMKYRPSYPGVFEDIESARAWVAHYVDWYNAQHHHSGLALFSPDQVHHGTWASAWQQRDTTLQAYYDAHPERFRSKPTTPKPASIAGINLPNATEQSPADRLHAA